MMIGDSGNMLLSFTGYGETVREAMDRATAAVNRRLASTPVPVAIHAVSHAIIPLAPHSLLTDTAGCAVFAATILVFVASEHGGMGS